MAHNSTTDIVNALVAKGVLTEEEGALLTKGRTDEAAGQAKALKKAGKVTVSDAIDNATIYGSMRLREEYRSGNGNTAASITADQKLVRTRGKFELGAKTTAGKWYSDVSFVTGSDASARSDNFTFGSANSATAYNQKESIFLKRAMLGWKATDWLTLEGGRMANPLYTTQMMWDGDYSVSGMTEKFNYTTGNLDLFATLGQWAHYKMERSVTDNYSNATTPVTTTSGEIYAFQGGAKYAINDRTSAKAALTHYVYGSPSARGIFKPTLVNTGPNITQSGVNDLSIFEVPAEINYMVTDTVGARVYGDYVINTDADKRAAVARSGAGFTDVDDTAWMLGLVVASAKDLKSFEGNKAKKGDWQGNLWYQEIGMFAVDPSLGDSDIFDSRLNFKGVTFKGQYLVEDNVSLNLTAAHGSRLNDKYNSVSGTGTDLKNLNLKDFDLLQLDVNYKF